MELELKDIREHPLILYILIAVVIHIVIGFVIWTQLKTPTGRAFISGNNQPIEKLPIIEGLNIPLDNPGNDNPPSETPASVVDQPDEPADQTDPEVEAIPIIDEDPPEEISEVVENEPDEPADNTGMEPETVSNTEELPPFEQSPLTNSHSSGETFVHESSGLLFADEIPLLDKNSTTIKKQKIVPPKIHREFTVRGLPNEFRSKEWNLKLRLRVNRDGNPVGKIKVIKSSGDDVLDQITITRVSESRFEPAHYEDSTDFMDYTFELDVNYK